MHFFFNFDFHSNVLFFLTQSYAKLLKSLLNENFAYLIDTMQYDQSQYPGPPLSVSVEEVTKLFGKFTSVLQHFRM